VKEVALIGQGLHPWGKFKEKSVNDLLRVSIENALADAGIEWAEIQAVSCASSRFSGGRGWGLNGNDVVEDMGATGIPVYNLSAGCAAGANAFNVGYSLIAGGIYDMVLVVGGEKMPKGFIQTSGVEEITDPEYLRQLCVGMPGPAFWGAMCRRRMADYGTTEEQLAKIAVKAHANSVDNEYARFRKEFSLEKVLSSAMVSYPLRLFEICPVSDGAAAVVLCSAEVAKRKSDKAVWVESSTVATAVFNDGIPRGLSSAIPAHGGAYHSEAKLAVEKALAAAGRKPKDIDFLELQDNTVYYELCFPEEWGFCEKGESEALVDAGVWQICELTKQLRGEAGTRQVPGANSGLAQTLGLGGNATAVVMRS